MEYFLLCKFFHSTFSRLIYIYTIIGKTCQHVVICEHIRLVYFGIASDSGVRYKNKVNIYIYIGKTCQHAVMAKHIQLVDFGIFSASGVCFRNKVKEISVFCVSTGCRGSRDRRRMLLHIPTRWIDEGYCRGANNAQYLFPGNCVS